MDFSLNSQQKALRKSAVEFARSRESESENAHVEKKFDDNLWKQYAEFGAQGITVPEKYGGQGLDYLSLTAIMDGLGQGANDNGFLLSLNTHIFGCIEPILLYGSKLQREKYLPWLCNGNHVGAIAMTEPEAGSDTSNIITEAVETQEHYILNGSKIFITNGGLADIILVFAKMPLVRGMNNVTCFIYEKGMAGMKTSSNIQKMGLTNSPFTNLYFDDCKIPKENVLGEVGFGKNIFNFAMDLERGLILASQLGMLKSQFKSCIKYAKSRKQFNKAIISYQSISNMLSKMKINIETSQLLIYKNAWLKTKRKKSWMHSAITKKHVSECCVQNSIMSMKIHGGHGYTKEMPCERELRDSFGWFFASGTGEMMDNFIVNLIE